MTHAALESGRVAPSTAGTQATAGLVGTFLDNLLARVRAVPRAWLAVAAVVAIGALAHATPVQDATTHDRGITPIEHTAAISIDRSFSVSRREAPQPDEHSGSLAALHVASLDFSTNTCASTHVDRIDVRHDERHCPLHPPARAPPAA